MRLFRQGGTLLVYGFLLINAEIFAYTKLKSISKKLVQAVQDSTKKPEKYYEDEACSTHRAHAQVLEETPTDKTQGIAQVQSPKADVARSKQRQSDKLPTAQPKSCAALQQKTAAILADQNLSKRQSQKQITSCIT